MPTTNGHEVSTGCVLDNHWGWHNHARLIATAVELGFPINDEEQATILRYDAGDDPDGSLAEVVAGQGGIMDDAEAWLNDHTPAECFHCGQPVELTDSGQWWRHVGLWRDTCGVQFADHARHYVWHWHDGDFLLSTLCDDPDECTDDMCGHWD